MFFTTFLKERIWLVAFIIAVLYFLVLIRSDMVQNDRFKHEKRSVTGAIESEKAKNASLKIKLRKLNNSSYIEDVAREKLGYVERGERAYKVITK